MQEHPIPSEAIASMAVKEGGRWSEEYKNSWRQGPHNPRVFAESLFAWEAMQPVLPDAPAEPYSLQWFLDIEKSRHSRQARWIPKLLEFSRHSGERLLGLGHGLGTDWVQYAANGASVVVCSPSETQLGLIRRNFEVRGLTGSFVSADPHRLPFESATIDVVCVSSLLHGIERPEAVVDEVFRVLKPGGKVLVVTPAYYDVDFFIDTLLFWRRWLFGSHRKPPIPEQRFSARQLRALFHPFVEHRVHKRQLRRSELPWMWKWIPPGIMARLMGRMLVLKAFKPVISTKT